MDTKVTLESIDKKIDSRYNQLDKKMDAGFVVLDKKIDNLDNKVEIYRQAIVERFDTIDARFDAIDARFDLFEDRISARFDEFAGILQRGFMGMKQNPYSDLLDE